MRKEVNQRITETPPDSSKEGPPGFFRRPYRELEKALNAGGLRALLTWELFAYITLPINFILLIALIFLVKFLGG